MTFFTENASFRFMMKLKYQATCRKCDDVIPAGFHAEKWAGGKGEKWEFICLDCHDDIAAPKPDPTPRATKASSNTVDLLGTLDSAFHACIK